MPRHASQPMGTNTGKPFRVTETLFLSGWQVWSKGCHSHPLFQVKCPLLTVHYCAVEFARSPPVQLGSYLPYLALVSSCYPERVEPSNTHGITSDSKISPLWPTSQVSKSQFDFKQTRRLPKCFRVCQREFYSSSCGVVSHKKWKQGTCKHLSPCNRTRDGAIKLGKAWTDTKMCQDTSMRWRSLGESAEIT